MKLSLAWQLMPYKILYIVEGPTERKVCLINFQIDFSNISLSKLPNAQIRSETDDLEKI